MNRLLEIKNKINTLRETTPGLGEALDIISKSRLPETLKDHMVSLSAAHFNNMDMRDIGYSYGLQEEIAEDALIEFLRANPNIKNKFIIVKATKLYKKFTTLKPSDILRVISDYYDLGIDVYKTALAQTIKTIYEDKMEYNPEELHSFCPTSVIKFSIIISKLSNIPIGEALEALSTSKALDFTSKEPLVNTVSFLLSMLSAYRQGKRVKGFNPPAAWHAEWELAGYVTKETKAMWVKENEAAIIKELKEIYTNGLFNKTKSAFFNFDELCALSHISYLSEVLRFGAVTERQVESANIAVFCEALSYIIGEKEADIANLLLSMLLYTDELRLANSIISFDSLITGTFAEGIDTKDATTKDVMIQLLTKTSYYSPTKIEELRKECVEQEYLTREDETKASVFPDIIKALDCDFTQMMTFIDHFRQASDIGVKRLRFKTLSAFTTELRNAKNTRLLRELLGYSARGLFVSQYLRLKSKLSDNTNSVSRVPNTKLLSDTALCELKDFLSEEQYELYVKAFEDKGIFEEFFNDYYKLRLSDRSYAEGRKALSAYLIAATNRVLNTSEADMTIYILVCTLLAYANVLNPETEEYARFILRKISYMASGYTEFVPEIGGNKSSGVEVLLGEVPEVIEKGTYFYNLIGKLEGDDLNNVCYLLNQEVDRTYQDFKDLKTNVRFKGIFEEISAETKNMKVSEYVSLIEEKCSDDYAGMLLAVTPKCLTPELYVSKMKAFSEFAKDDDIKDLKLAEAFEVISSYIL